MILSPRLIYCSGKSFIYSMKMFEKMLNHVQRGKVTEKRRKKRSLSKVIKLFY